MSASSGWSVGSPPGELQRHGLALGVDQGLQGAACLCPAQLESLKCCIGQAHRAGQVTTRRDFDDGRAGTSSILTFFQGFDGREIMALSSVQ
jgi:hypothetical protein